MKDGLGDLAACDADQLARNRQQPAQAHSVPAALIDGFLAPTGLSLAPEPP